MITWLIRAGGLLLLAIGFGLFMSPLAVIADFIPPLGSVVRMGTGLVAFLLAIVVGTITIAIAWFYYRPLLAVGILVVGAVIAAAIIYIGRARRQVAAPAPARRPHRPDQPAASLHGEERLDFACRASAGAAGSRAASPRR